jgi:putative transposase
MHGVWWWMNELPYPSDLTEAQWALIEPLLPAPKPKGRKRRVDLRKITNGILYVLKGGISWRMLPREFAPWKTAYPLLSTLAARRAVGPDS